MKPITSVKIKRKTEAKPAPRNQNVSGHEIIIASAMSKRTKLTIELISGKSVEGTVTQFDRYTLTVRKDNGSMRTYFKHAIEGFGVGE